MQDYKTFNKDVATISKSFIFLLCLLTFLKAALLPNGTQNNNIINKKMWHLAKNLCYVLFCSVAMLCVKIIHQYAERFFELMW